MEQIKLGKVKKLTPEERDELDRKYQVGKYRPYQVDWERIKQLEKETREEYSEIMKAAYTASRKPVGSGRGSGKKQQAAELERLKQELENG